MNAGATRKPPFHKDPILAINDGAITPDEHHVLVRRILKHGDLSSKIFRVQEVITWNQKEIGPIDIFQASIPIALSPKVGPIADKPQPWVIKALNDTCGTIW